ncbi:MULTISPECIES: AAA family ATPase [Flavobacterium]|uniref:AAA family ATPase n=1 Tax=Flavobacterium jumunjinense TaxID=998845 RepID=A0ABV5GNY4_9FLAO|nr:MULTISPECIES: AAA family ATPase [Flavobacterium]
MKISKLHIEQFRHLENLTFDFTYQSGERKGQPLDKICFIGQSATGKTGLLELINSQFSFINNLFVSKNFYHDEPGEKKSFFGNIKFNWENNFMELNDKELKYNNKTYQNKFIGGMSGELLPLEDKKRLFYFKTNLISENNLDFFYKNPIDLIEKHNEQLSDLSHYFKYTHNREFIFNENADPRIWLFTTQDILNYRKKFTQKMSELLHEGLLSNPEKLSSEFEKWQKDNPNELEKFAKKFNPILEKLHLEVDLVNTEYVIPIANKRNEEIIPIQNTSTGTKGLLLSFLPLFKLDTKDSIILIDEPERSLYPDMQMDLMDYYQNLAPEAQFIVATHSPFVAASFEPEERFILYFNKEGKVAVRRGTSPIGDDPNDMLYNDFGINYINKYGQEKHNEYKELKQKVFFEKDENKKREIVEKLEKLGEEYNF